MPERDDEGYLDLNEEEMSGEQIDSQVQRAQEQLLALKRQQDFIEKQKRELEELSRRQEQLHQGKAEMIEKLTRALVVLEREMLDAERRVELLKAIDDSYRAHLEVLESINPKSWDGADLNRELSKALSAVDDARTEYSKSRSRISPEPGSEGESLVEGGYAADFEAPPAQNFVYWLKSGFAFTLPLLVTAVILTIVLLVNLGR